MGDDSESMDDVFPKLGPFDTQEMDDVPVQPVYEHEKVGSTDVFLEKLRRQQEQEAFEEKQTLEKKGKIEKQYRETYKNLAEALNEKTQDEFLQDLEDKVYDGGSLDDYYKEVAKLDALKWLDTYKDDVLNLNLPQEITLTFSYDLAAQPKSLTDFFNDAKSLIESNIEIGKRTSTEVWTEKTQKKKKQRQKDETVEGIVYVPTSASVKNTDQDYPVQNNRQIRLKKNTKEIEGITGKKNWFLAEVEPKKKLDWFFGKNKTKKKFKVSKPPARFAKYVIETKDEKNEWQQIKNADIDEVFGVVRITVPKTVVYLRYEADLKKYEAAKEYWANQVKEKSGVQKDKYPFGVNLNAGPGVTVKDRAYFTPYVKESTDQEVTITYVTQEGEVTSKDFNLEDAPVKQPQFVQEEDDEDDADSTNDDSLFS